ncbi:MAG: Na+/H+ antiporter, partial [uncultured Nocardioides sp.]
VGYTWPCDSRPGLPRCRRQSAPRDRAARAAEPLGDLRTDGPGRGRHADRADPAARRPAPGPPVQPGRHRAHDRAGRADRPDGRRAGAGPSARAPQPCELEAMGGHLAPPADRDAPDHRRGGRARMGCRPRPGRSDRARSRAGAHRPRPRLRRPGRGTTDGRPRGRRVGRAPLHAHLGGRAQRRSRLPLRLRRHPARDRGGRLQLGTEVARLLPRRQGRHRGAGRHRRGTDAGLPGVPLQESVPPGGRARGVTAGAGGAGHVVRRRRGPRRLRFPLRVRVRDDLPLGRALPRLPRGHARGGRAARAAPDPLRAPGPRHRRDPWAARRAGLARGGRRSRSRLRRPTSGRRARARSRGQRARGGRTVQEAAVGSGVLRGPRCRVDLLPRLRGRGGTGAGRELAVVDGLVHDHHLGLRPRGVGDAGHVPARRSHL